MMYHIYTRLQVENFCHSLLTLKVLELAYTRVRLKDSYAYNGQLSHGRRQQRPLTSWLTDWWEFICTGTTNKNSNYVCIMQ